MFRKALLSAIACLLTGSLFAAGQLVRIENQTDRPLRVKAYEGNSRRSESLSPLEQANTEQYFFTEGTVFEFAYARDNAVQISTADGKMKVQILNRSVDSKSAHHEFKTIPSTITITKEVGEGMPLRVS